MKYALTLALGLLEIVGTILFGAVLIGIVLAAGYGVFVLAGHAWRAWR